MSETSVAANFDTLGGEPTVERPEGKLVPQSERESGQ